MSWICQDLCVKEYQNNTTSLNVILNKQGKEKKNISQEKKIIKKNECNLKRGKDEFHLRGKEDD